jgi:hypothetical protein
MKFICSGLVKTGTKSLAQSLRILGYKVYDFDDQILYYGDQFFELYFGNKVPDFYRMFKDVDAVVDVPCSFFFEEMMEAFPDAKVILSVRTDEEAWIKSCQNQIQAFYSAHKNSWMRYFSPTYNQYYLLGLAADMATLGTTDYNAAYIYRKRYRWHNDRVKSLVPSEKLLVFSVEQGWEPLCEFTGKKMPDQPFPHLNVKCSVMKTFQTETEFGRKMAGEAKFVKICFAIFVVLMAMLVYSYIL